MKRTLSLVLVFILALVVAPVALAGAHGKGKAHDKVHQAKAAKAKAHGKNKFQLNGVVVSVDTTANDTSAGSLVVTVKSGTKTVKAYRGQPLMVMISPKARFVNATGDAADAPPPLTLADLVAGARVHLGGTIDRTDRDHPIFTAAKVIVRSLPTASTPEPTDTATPTPSDTGTPTPDQTKTPVALIR